MLPYCETSQQEKADKRLTDSVLQKIAGKIIAPFKTPLLAVDTSKFLNRGFVFEEAFEGVF